MIFSRYSSSYSVIKPWFDSSCVNLRKNSLYIEKLIGILNFTLLVNVRILMNYASRITPCIKRKCVITHDLALLFRWLCEQRTSMANKDPGVSYHSLS